MSQSYEIQCEIEAELQDLADQINREHDEFDSLLRNSLDRAAHAGHLLLEVKSKLEHGQFGPWVEKNCHFTTRTAQRFIRVARFARKALAESPGEPLAHRQALKALTAPSKSGRSKKDVAGINALIQEMIGPMERLVEYIRHCKTTMNEAQFQAVRSDLTRGGKYSEIESLFQFVEGNSNSLDQIWEIIFGPLDVAV